MSTSTWYFTFAAPSNNTLDKPCSSTTSTSSSDQRGAPLQEPPRPHLLRRDVEAAAGRHGDLGRPPARGLDPPRPARAQDQATDVPAVDLHPEGQRLPRLGPPEDPQEQGQGLHGRLQPQDHHSADDGAAAHLVQRAHGTGVLRGAPAQVRSTV